MTTSADHGYSGLILVDRTRGVESSTPLFLMVCAHGSRLLRASWVTLVFDDVLMRHDQVSRTCRCLACNFVKSTRSSLPRLTMC